MNTWHQPARAAQLPSTLTLCTNSAHPYQNKRFISPLFSHRCAHLRPQALCFDMLHKNTRGEGWLPCQQFLPESGGGKAPNPKREERFLAARTPLGMTKREEGGMTARRRGKRKTGTMYRAPTGGKAGRREKRGRSRGDDGAGGGAALHDEHEGNHGQAHHGENPVHVNEGQHGGLALQFVIQDSLGLMRSRGPA